MAGPDAWAGGNVPLPPMLDSLADLKLDLDMNLGTRASRGLSSLLLGPADARVLVSPALSQMQIQHKSSLKGLFEEDGSYFEGVGDSMDVLTEDLIKELTQDQELFPELAQGPGSGPSLAALMLMAKPAPEEFEVMWSHSMQTGMPACMQDLSMHHQPQTWGVEEAHAHGYISPPFHVMAVAAGGPYDSHSHPGTPCWVPGQGGLKGHPSAATAMPFESLEFPPHSPAAPMAGSSDEHYSRCTQQPQQCTWHPQGGGHPPAAISPQQMMWGPGGVLQHPVPPPRGSTQAGPPQPPPPPPPQPQPQPQLQPKPAHSSYNSGVAPQPPAPVMHSAGAPGVFYRQAAHRSLRRLGVIASNVGSVSGGGTELVALLSEQLASFMRNVDQAVTDCLLHLGLSSQEAYQAVSGCLSSFSDAPLAVVKEIMGLKIRIVAAFGNMMMRNSFAATTAPSSSCHSEAGGKARQSGGGAGREGSAGHVSGEGQERLHAALALSSEVQERLLERFERILRSSACQLWAMMNVVDPKPNKAGKEMLARYTGKTHKQVTDWFTNWRARHWRPGMQTLAREICASSGGAAE